MIAVETKYQEVTVLNKLGDWARAVFSVTSKQVRPKGAQDEYILRQEIARLTPSYNELRAMAARSGAPEHMRNAGEEEFPF